MRLDLLLRARFPQKSRAFLQKLVKEGRIKIDGKAVRKPHHEVSAKAELTCDFPAVVCLPKLPLTYHLPVVFEDDDLLVLDKPAGISMHPSGTERRPTLVDFLQEHCGRGLSSAGGVERPGIVHRLDKDTSGLVIVAKADAAHALLARQFAERTVEKEYTALVKGALKPRRGAIEAGIGRSLKDRKKMALRKGKGARAARTEYAVTKTFSAPQCSLILAFPKTGRTHQIRVHFAGIEHPIVGDALYGDARTNELFEALGLTRQFLHASKLSFLHPRTRKKLTFTSQLPLDLAAVLKQLTP